MAQHTYTRGISQKCKSGGLLYKMFVCPCGRSPFASWKSEWELTYISKKRSNRKLALFCASNFRLGISANMVSPSSSIGDSTNSEAKAQYFAKYQSWVAGPTESMRKSGELSKLFSPKIFAKKYSRSGGDKKEKRRLLSSSSEDDSFLKETSLHGLKYINKSGSQKYVLFQ